MPTNSVQVLLAQDIPDPTDFSATELRQLDASVRCSICGEFFDAPVSLACGHCFCSMCIREHILRESECPSCRKPVTESQFRLNPVLEEIVSAWKVARSTVIRLSRLKATSAQSPSNDKTPRQHRTPAQSGRKRRRAEVSESSDSDVVCVAGPSNANHSSEIARSSPLQAKSARKNASRRRASVEPSSDSREEGLEPTSMVNCPMCDTLVEYRAINAHMDGPDCGQKLPADDNNSSSSNARTEWLKLFDGGKSKKGKHKDNGDSDDLPRLPKVSYDVLKDRALKDLLSSQGLSVGGDRNSRVARHRRWVMMYNANLDKATRRKTLPDLRFELKTWEEGQKGSEYAVDDPLAYEILHRDAFSRLAEEARQRTVACPVSGDVPQLIEDDV